MKKRGRPQKKTKTKGEERVVQENVDQNEKTVESPQKDFESPVKDDLGGFRIYWNPIQEEANASIAGSMSEESDHQNVEESFSMYDYFS